MKKTFAIALFAATALASSAFAMSPANVGQMNNTAGTSNVIQVAGGCGPGWHRGPYGGCRRNWANPAAHACPRGYHIGPGGRCRGNGR